MNKEFGDNSTYQEIYSLDNRELVTFNTFVPISCGDIHRLETTRALLSRNRQPVEGAATRSVLFFGNHPIKWVQIVGKTLDVYYSPAEAKECSFSVVDGLGGPPLKCYINSRNSQLLNRTLTNNQIVVILGLLTGPSRVEVIRISAINPQDICYFFLLREETIAVRKYVLERDAEIFQGIIESLKTIERPKRKITEIINSQTSLLRRRIQRQKRRWGHPDYDLTLNSVNIKEMWPAPK